MVIDYPGFVSLPIMIPETENKLTQIAFSFEETASVAAQELPVVSETESP